MAHLRHFFGATAFPRCNYQLTPNTQYFHSIPTSICSITQAKKAISRQPICLTDADYDYILEEIGQQEKIEYEGVIEVYSDDMEY